MAEDKHFGTGEYDPEKYFSTRAKASKGDAYRAVCVLGASEVENETAHRVQTRAITKALSGLGLGGGNVLEYGCGVGRWVPFFQRRGAVWHGVDISSEMLSEAKERHGDVELKKVTDNGIPYPDSSMDLVYSVTVIHHNPYDAQERIVAEMARVLKSGGHLLLLEDLRGDKAFHMFPRNVSSWVELVEKHGLSLCLQEGINYWILRELTAKAFRGARRLLPARAKSGAVAASAERRGLKGFLQRFVNRVDVIIDPYIYPIVPERYRDASVFLFRKA